MKPMDFFDMRGADPPPHLLCGKGLQRYRAKKDYSHRAGFARGGDAVSCKHFGRTEY